MLQRSRSIPSLIVILIIAAYFCFVLNLALWKSCFRLIPINGFMDLLFVLSAMIAIYCAHIIVCSVLLIPFIGKVILIILLLVSSVANYMMYNFGILVDQDMIRNIFETHASEALDLLNGNMLLWVVISGIVPSYILYKITVRYSKPFSEFKKRIGVVLACLLIAGLSFAGFYKQHVSFGRNNSEIRKLVNTGNYIYATIRYAQKKLAAPTQFVIADNKAVHVPFADPQHTVFILIVGETARSMNFSLNGYKRQTNPELEKRDVISFQDVTSCGTATAVSLPCMFSHLPRYTFDVDREKSTENLLDILKKSDFQVLWKENDHGCKGVCNRIPTLDMRNQPRLLLCDGDVCHDEILLENLESYLKTITKDTFIVLHTMGSHGPSYFRRYPKSFEKFTPVCNTSDLNNCTVEKIVNTYDNTILYTDYIVSQTIDILNKFPNF